MDLTNPTQSELLARIRALESQVATLQQKLRDAERILEHIDRQNKVMTKDLEERKDKEAKEKALEETKKRDLLGKLREQVLAASQPYKDCKFAGYKSENHWEREDELKIYNARKAKLRKEYERVYTLAWDEFCAAVPDARERSRWAFPKWEGQTNY